MRPPEENDFPDVEGRMVSRRRVDVELAEWLHREELEAAKLKERIENILLDAIGELGTNATRHFGFVWLQPKAGIRFSAADGAKFRTELLACLDDCDKKQFEEWLSPKPVQVDRVVDLLFCHPPCAHPFSSSV